jgi:hypothetical protein
MVLEDTEARNNCAGEDQQEFNRPTLAVSFNEGTELSGPG